MPWRALLNRLRRTVARALLHRMVFGETCPLSGAYRPYSRISPNTCLEHAHGLSLADHVYIGPYNWLECSGGITLDEGVQITSHCSLTTHSSHRSLRLMGRQFSKAPHHAAPGHVRPGWITGPIHIGAYTFIGPHSLIEAGTHLGRGTLVCAGSVVRGHHPDFAVLRGNPAQVVGDTRHADAELLRQHPEARAHYEAWAGSQGQV